MAPRTAAKVAVLALTDLSGITRNSHKLLTTVTIEDGDMMRDRIEWLRLGQARVRHARDRHDGRWVLEAYLDKGATDFEEDSAYAIRLPLIGATFEGVDYHTTNLLAWVDPNAGGPHPEFHVPTPGYNPLKHPDTTVCKRCKPHHPIVPTGMYVPPFDPDLYALVAGKKVSIHVGPRHEGDE